MDNGESSEPDELDEVTLIFETPGVITATMHPAGYVEVDLMIGGAKGSEAFEKAYLKVLASLEQMTETDEYAKMLVRLPSGSMMMRISPQIATIDLPRGFAVVAAICEVPEVFRFSHVHNMKHLPGKPVIAEAFGYDKEGAARAWLENYPDQGSSEA